MKRNATCLYCFSPAVMIATVVIEVTLVLYVYLKVRLKAYYWPLYAMLFCLAAFQLAEFVICTGRGDPAAAARVGYAAITLLPPLAVDLVSRLNGGRWRKLVYSGYAAAIPFLLIFSVLPGNISPVCGGNYVIFYVPTMANQFYTWFYFGYIAVANVLAYQTYRFGSVAARRASRWFMVGTAAFIVPAAVIVAAQYTHVAGLPSILCGFAVLLALALGLRVAPILEGGTAKAGRKRYYKAPRLPRWV